VSSPSSHDFAHISLAFAGLEPGDGQRWSTWPALTPSQRGPRPYPHWLVTSAAAFDTELGVVKTGKEADVFLIERAVPDAADDLGLPGMTASTHSILAAKRYRGAENSDFHRSAQYREGRGFRRTRDERAVGRKSAYGRAVSSGRWALAEFEALCTAYRAGVPVPYPVQVNETEILMEFIAADPGSLDGVAAPRLAQLRPNRTESWELFDQVVEIMRAFARAGTAHGDLSPYNLLVQRGRVIVIDLPQLVEIASNPNGLALLERDCVNVCDWFIRRGLDVDAGAVFGELVAEVY
jgi:Serine/threonine protein kinase involved in cell cycle control